MWVIGKKYEGEVEGTEKPKLEPHFIIISPLYIDRWWVGGWSGNTRLVVVVWDRGFTGNKYLRDVQSKAQNKTEEEFIIKVKTKVCHSIGGYKPEADYIIIA